MLIDAHMHLWSLGRLDYDWLTPALPLLYRDFDIEDYRHAARELPLDGCVLVQASASEAETDWLLDLAARHTEILGVVGWFDPTAPCGANKLRARREAGMVGVRPMLQDWPNAAEILALACVKGMELLEASGLVFEALVRPHQLGVIVELAKRHPGLTIVLDHGGKPDIRSSAWQPWADDVAALADQANVRCKLSGLATEAESGATTDCFRPYAQQLSKCFCDDRLLWGSDWPLIGMRMPLAQWHAMAAILAADLGLSGNKLFGDNARETYRLVIAS